MTAKCCLLSFSFRKMRDRMTEKNAVGCNERCGNDGVLGHGEHIKELPGYF
ncbi:hypothetical protein [Neobacillus novalis]|uniref:hypothetical protein n=1 Tax=Neobacillus novalis TaxID=220687 RepID=UPI00157A2D25|nr:hypothetical protein [Neobacillus novalis]